MSAVVLQAEHLKKAYTLKPLLTDATLYVSERDRMGIVGINGTGKSTLLRMLAGEEEPDSGTVTRRRGISVSFLPQMPDYGRPNTATAQVLCDCSKDMGQPDEYEARAMLTRLGILDTEADVRSLSGGQKKRVALAAALIRPADVLLLDEPTNHLDAQTINWLEDRLMSYPGAILMVTHDRYFLDRICTHIAELDGGGLYLHEGSYSLYLEQKAARLEMETAWARKRSSILRRELAWIRHGAPARSTKQKARIQRYEEMSAVKGPKQEDRLTLISSGSRLGRTIIECRDISKSMGERKLLSGFDLTLVKDARIAVTGPNGCGKTTLLHMLAGELAPDSGTVSIGETVRIGFLRQDFPIEKPDQRLIDYMRDIAEYVETKDGRLSASQMLESFLFPPDVQYTPVGRLSGGEKRRLYLAGLLMASPNVLLLDEPTNDLDIATLEILEDYLDGFRGAVIAVSHDRWFIDRVTNRLLAFEDGRVNQYVCSFTAYLDMRAAQLEEAAAGPAEEAVQSSRPRERELRMSWREKKEFREIDGLMEGLQNRLLEIDAETERAASDYKRLTELSQEREETQQALSQAEERWLYLTDLAEKTGYTGGDD